MPSAALRFIDMLFSSSGFPSKSVIVLEVVLLSTSPALCRDFICTDTAHVAHPFGLALAAGTRIGLIGRNDPLSTLDGGPSRKPIRPSTRSKCWVHTCCKSPSLGQSRTCWGACSSSAACEPMPAIFSHLSAQECFRLLAFGKALQLKAMHIAIKPVRADDSQQPVRGHFCDLAQSRSQALSHTFQATESTHICQYKGRVRALLAPSGSAIHVHGRPAKWVRASDPAPHD